MSVWAAFSLYQFQSWSLFSSLAWLIIAQRVWAMRDYSFSAILLMVGCRDVRTWIWQETCRHLYISVKAGRLRPPRMTDHKCTWLVGKTNQHAWIQSPFLCAGHIWLHGFSGNCTTGSWCRASLPFRIMPSSYPHFVDTWNNYYIVKSLNFLQLFSCQ